MELTRNQQPELITLGPSTRMVSVEAIAHELSLLPWEAQQLLDGLQVPTVDIGSQKYVLVAALELAIWKKCAPAGFELKTDPALAAQQVEELGRAYRGMARDVVERRLANLLDPLRQIRRRRTRRQRT